MKPRSVLVNLLIVMATSSLSVAQGVNCSTIGEEAKPRVVGVTVQVVEASVTTTSIVIHYKVKNDSSEAFYVYAPDLRGPATEVRINGHKLIVGTLPFNISQSTSYDRPNPAFVELLAGETIERKFTDGRLAPRVQQEMENAPSIALTVGVTRRKPEELKRLVTISEQNCSEDSRNVLVRALETIVSQPVQAKHTGK